MVRPICKDNFLLSMKSAPATADDLGTAQDLLDTLAAHSHECVGMAANMIGVLKRIIVFQDSAKLTVMLNPTITKRSGKEYEAEEGCLSHSGTKTATRFESIEVEYLDMKLKKQKKHYSGFTAQIIQHECDHLDGILI
ncbi:MAG: peptide deformylase [Oscillospiraceae bacterium]|nr:peptide deformylase [Oscillospiraceae bacterium]